MLSSRLKEIRMLNNISQKDLADQLNTTAQAISYYEKNQRDVPNELFTQFAEKFNINLHWLLTGSGSMFLTDQTLSGECPNCKELEKAVEQLQSNIDLLKSIIEKACSHNHLAEKKITG